MVSKQTHPFTIETDDGTLIGGALQSADAVVLAAGAVAVVRGTLIVRDTSSGSIVGQIGRDDVEQPVLTVGPRLDSINPASTPLGLPPQLISVTGDGFDEGAVIIWEDKAQTTTFVSSTQLSTRLDPPLVDPDYEPGETVPVQVRNPDGNISNTANFEWEV